MRAVAWLVEFAWHALCMGLILVNIVCFTDSDAAARSAHGLAVLWPGAQAGEEARIGGLLEFLSSVSVYLRVQCMH